MLTIADRVSNWVRSHPFHASFMSRGLLNASALARVIKPELEADAGEMLSVDAITLALNRMTRSLKIVDQSDFEQFIGEVSVQSGLSILTIPQVDLKLDVFFDAVKKLHNDQEYTLYTRGVWHTALIGKRGAIEALSAHFKNTILTHDLVAITVKLKPGHLLLPGVCAYVLEKIAHNGINLNEVTSSHDELTVIIERQYTQAALSCLV